MSKSLYVVEFTVDSAGDKSFDCTAHVVASSAAEAASIQSSKDGVEFDVERVALVDESVYETDESGAMHRL